MARRSDTDNVRKVCGCVKWKECAHPWYVSYREGKELVNGKIRERGLRKRLSLLVGREPKDYAGAKIEARRAIVAWKDGLDATTLIPGDRPTLAALLQQYGERPGGAPAKSGPLEKVVVNGRAFGEWPADAITRDMIEAFRRARAVEPVARQMRAGEDQPALQDIEEPDDADIAETQDRDQGHRAPLPRPAAAAPRPAPELISDPSAG